MPLNQSEPKMATFAHAFGYWRFAAPLLAWLAIAAGPAAARQFDAGEAKIAACIRQAAGGRLWLENTLWGLRDQEGGWVGAAILNTNGTRDLGPLQVNSAWVPRIAALIGRSTVEVHSWLRWDPCFNADTARWLFLNALNATGDYWKAVGLYHSPTTTRQQRYALSVANRMKSRFGVNVFCSPTAQRPACEGSSILLAKPASPKTSAVQLHGFGKVADANEWPEGGR
jgi:hypothetical protein